MKGSRVHNTGKVLIGLAYEPPRQRCVTTADASRLQAALLAKPRPNSLQRLLRQLRKDNR